ncbi:hypothetical protein FRZ67_17200 [Panacibacter ginsenosidivorans]|uniref:Uncharacterized protein n=1 Tax=Panacibacter ginsenosidivorans TaxID=1813871 RepID=A0A5B8VBS3_9BACT|nr:hypothetical protein FRZ67_17200 [Panacibacter ginsenosidivorans]
MIYVFKTSVKNKKHIRQLSPLLNSLLQQSKWNFDLEDCDKILRIDCDENVVFKIIDLLNIHKFYCEKLE